MSHWEIIINLQCKFQDERFLKQQQGLRKLKKPVGVHTLVFLIIVHARLLIFEQISALHALVGNLHAYSFLQVFKSSFQEFHKSSKQIKNQSDGSKFLRNFPPCTLIKKYSTLHVYLKFKKILPARLFGSARLLGILEYKEYSSVVKHRLQFDRSFFHFQRIMLKLWHR